MARGEVKLCGPRKVQMRARPFWWLPHATTEAVVDSKSLIKAVR